MTTVLFTLYLALAAVDFLGVENRSLAGWLHVAIGLVHWLA